MTLNMLPILLNILKPFAKSSPPTGAYGPWPASEPIGESGFFRAARANGRVLSRGANGVKIIPPDLRPRLGIHLFTSRIPPELRPRLGIH